MPHGEAIDAADGHELLETDLPVAALAAALRAAGGRAVVSHNAGRFVCNYLLFRSLQRSRARAPRWHSLFVHLPCVGGAAGARQLLEVRARAALCCAVRAGAQSRACKAAPLSGTHSSRHTAHP
jgi:pyrrolidone-carboxylate peptidase